MQLLKPLLLGAVAAGILAPGTAAHADPSIDQIEKRIATESARLEKVVEQYNKITEELKASAATASSVRIQLGPLTAQLNAASARIGAIAAQAYKGGTLAEVSAVLGSPDPSVVFDRLLTLDQITKYERLQMAGAAAVKGQHDVEAAKLAVLIDGQKARRQALADQKKKINGELTKLYDLRRQAYGSAKASSSSSGGTVSVPYVAGKAGVAVRYAYAQLGKPYEWAADGPNSYDCSGLTLAAWRAAGVTLSHNAEMQWNELPHISRSALKPGDLVFYSGLGHVGIFVGSGQIIHAPTFGENVQLSSVDMMPPYGYARPG